MPCYQFTQTNMSNFKYYQIRTIKTVPENGQLYTEIESVLNNAADAVDVLRIAEDAGQRLDVLLVNYCETAGPDRQPEISDKTLQTLTAKEFLAEHST